MPPTAGDEAYQQWLKAHGYAPEHTGFADHALKLAKEYGLGVALGAGAGALAGSAAFGVGAIPGAIIGASTALGSQYAAPRAAKALPEGTPDWVRTGVEYGIYGASAPLGLGGAAGGVGSVSARVALPAALKIAALSASGAVGGKEAAKVLGLPEGLGTFMGSLLAPTAGEAGWRGARNALANVEAPEGSLRARIRDAVAPLASEAARPSVMATVASASDQVAREQAAIERDKLNLGRKSPERDDSAWLLDTGYTRDDMRALASGQHTAKQREALTPEYVREARRLPTRYNQLAVADQMHTQAQAQLDALTQEASGANEFQRLYTGTTAGRAKSIQQGGFNENSFFTQEKDVAQYHAEKAAEAARLAGEADATPQVLDVWAHPSGVEELQQRPGSFRLTDPAAVRLQDPKTTPGDLQALPDHYEWVDTAGNRRVVPDEVAQRYATARDTAAHAANTLANRTQVIAESLGVTPEDIPHTPEDADLLLRQKHAPEASEDAFGRPMLSRAEASQLYQDGLAKDEAWRQAYHATADQYGERIGWRQRYVDFLKSDAAKPLGAVPHLNGSQAFRDFVAWQQQEDLQKVAKGVMHMARESVQPYSEYVPMAAAISDAYGGNTGRALFRDLTEVNHRGELGFLDSEGIWQPVTFKQYVREGRRVTGVQVQRPFLQPEVVPVNKLSVRYNQDQLTALMGEWAGAAENSKNRAEALGVEPGNFGEGVVLPNARLDEDVYPNTKAWEQAAERAAARGDPAPPRNILEEWRENAWHQFASNFVPPEVTVEGQFQTLEQQRQYAMGLSRSMLQGPRRGASLTEIKDMANTRQWFLESKRTRQMQYRSVEDEDILHWDASTDPDPVRSYLLSRGRDPIADMTANDTTGLGGSTKQAVINAISGQAIPHPGVHSLNENYFRQVEAGSNEVGAMLGSAVVNFRRAIADKLGAPKGLVAQAAAGADAAFEAAPNPFGMVRSFANQLHPLSRGTNETNIFLRKAFSVDALRTGDEMAQHQAAVADRIVRDFGQDRLDQAIDLLATNPMNVADPALQDGFKSIVNEPEVQAFRNIARSYLDPLEKVVVYDGAKALSRSQELSMMIARGFRDHVSQDIYKATNVGFFDVVHQMLTAAKDGGVKGKPLSEMMTAGMEAAFTRPMALKQALNINGLVRGLSNFAKEGESLNADDVLFRGGNWQIRSLNKFNPETQKSIQGLNGIINGTHGGLDDVVRVSQNISLGVLAADLSLLGIHGFKFAAQGLLSGHPLQAATALARGASTIMSDYGFYSWLKSNQEEVDYYARLGLTGGLRGYIAGPDVTKMPLENLPSVAGDFNTAVRQISDLQYNRMLYYWKTEAVRLNMEFAQMMRGMTSDWSEKFVGATNHKNIASAIGGIDAYRTADNDTLAKAVIRQVNNSLGGIDLRAQGVSARRQAVEQIMTIVPGFFRAQVGQWATIATKPNTLEGWVAATMAAREVMFAGSVAVGMAKLLGTEHLINWDNPTKANWLAVPTDEKGSYISVLSTTAIPRIIGRAVNETLKGAEGVVTGEGGGFGYQKALEAFAHGRMSPAAGALYDAVTDKDFLGRKYDGYDVAGVHVPGAVDRWSSALERNVLPIVLQSSLDDVKEALRGSGINMNELMLNSGAQIIGKNYVPASPGNKLNEYAQNAFGTDFNLLTDAQKYQLRQNPGVAATEAEYNYYSARRATTESAHVDAAYRRYSEQADAKTGKIWNDPMMIGNFKSTQADDDKLLNSGSMSGDDWRDRYHTRQQAVSTLFDELQKELHAEGVDPEKTRVERIKRMATAHDPNDAAYLLQLAKTEYSGVALPTMTRQIATPDGDVAVQAVDWDKFEEMRNEVLGRYPKPIADAVKLGTNPDVDAGVQQYHAASDIQHMIENVPRYRGLSNDQGDKLDAMRAVLRASSQQLSQQIGLPPGQSAPGISDLARQLGLKQMVAQRLVTSQADMSLATMALALDTNPTLADAMANPQQVGLILAHPETVKYYPYLLTRVPKMLRNRIPATQTEALAGKQAVGQFGGQ